MFSFLFNSLHSSWLVLNQSAFYVLFGLAVGGLFKMYLSPTYVAAHLGKGRFSSVFKAALLGVPMPLCSCGVLPAAATLKKQGANNGAVTAFLISTPESGVDSILLSWGLLDPILTIARPISAFISAAVAGLLENSFSFQDTPQPQPAKTPFALAPQASCCASTTAALPTPPQDFFNKVTTGLSYAVNNLWPDIAGWFFIGILLAGVITELVPDKMISAWLGGGLSSMLLMLVIGIPLYICASGSTPIAAAFIMKGVSPGTALVFLLAGPATNATSITVLVGLLGKRAVALYLLSIAVVSVLCGLVVDAIYLSFGIKASAMVGHHGGMLPHWVMLAAVIVLLALSVRPLLKAFSRWFSSTSKGCKEEGSCGCAKKQV
jgi:hypothetical protein